MPSVDPEPRTVTVFAASSLDDRPAMVDAAKRVVAMCASRGCSITFGGASVGLMGVIAAEAARIGVPLTGIIPEFLEAIEPASRDCSTVLRVKTMAERKDLMLKSADALCVLPGGFGTLEETLEAITLKQLGVLNIPIAMVNVSGYFDSLISFVDSCEQYGSIVLRGRDTFRVYPTVDKAFAYLCP